MGLTWPEVLGRLSRREPLSAAEAEETLQIVVAGEATPAQVGAFLALLHAKGETAEEVTGLARAMVDAAVPCPLAEQDADAAVDLVGTGGDRLSSINVTTLAAFITAGCGVPVCKHGNRAASSSVGTADVLEALGVAIEFGPEGVARCVPRGGHGVLFRPALPPGHALRRSRPQGAWACRPCSTSSGPSSTRRGPGASWSASATRPWRRSWRGSSGRRGAAHALIVHADDGLDELSVTSPATGAAGPRRRGRRLRGDRVAGGSQALGLAPATHGGSARRGRRLQRRR